MHVHLISAFAAGMRLVESMDVVHMCCAVHANKRITAIPCLHEIARSSLPVQVIALMGWMSSVSQEGEGLWVGAFDTH